LGFAALAKMTKRWLSKNLIVLTLVSLTQDAASDLLYPLLPLLLTGVIGAAPLALGLIEGCAEAAAGFSKLYAGKFSDRIGRKPFVSAGYTMAGIGKLFVVLATSWPLVFFGRVTDRIGKGMRSSPRDALINDSVSKEDLGKAFGFHRAGDNLGAVIGPALALLGLALLNDDVRAVAKWAMIPAVLSGLLTFLVRDNFVKPSKTIYKIASNYKLSSALKIRIFTLVAIQLTNIPDALLLLRLHQIGFSAKGVVGAYMLFSTVSMLLAFPAGVLSDKLNPRIIYAIGLLFFGFGYFTLGFTDSHVWAIVAITTYGVFPALTDGVGKAWIASLSPQEHRGKIQGIYQSSMNFAVLGAGIWGGALWSSQGKQWPLMIAGIGAFIGSLTLLTIRPQHVQP
jgi:MFS family permease